MNEKREKTKKEYNPLRFVSAASHGVGILLFIAGTVALLVKSAVLKHSPLHYVAFALYGASGVSLYSASTLYHSLRASLKVREFLKKLDHSMIYVLIAGSYTPICLIVIWQEGGKVMLPIIWSLALLGVVSSIIWIKKPSWLSSLLYLAMGWLALVVIKPLFHQLSLPAMILLATGGILYSIGAVFYALRWPGRYNPIFGFHELFHFFVLAGSFCHFLLIYKYIC